MIARAVAEPLSASPKSGSPAAKDVSPFQTAPGSARLASVTLISVAGGSAASRSASSSPPLVTKVSSLDVSSRSRATVDPVEPTVQAAIRDSGPLVQTVTN